MNRKKLMPLRLQQKRRQPEPRRRRKKPPLQRQLPRPSVKKKRQLQRPSVRKKKQLLRLLPRPLSRLKLSRRFLMARHFCSLQLHSILKFHK